jgi:uncharacterized membrane protein
MTNTVYRSVVKTITWRIVGTIDTIVISYFITGSFKMGVVIGSIEIISKMVLYFLHERVWQHVNFGKR